MQAHVMVCFPLPFALADALTFVLLLPLAE